MGNTYNMEALPRLEQAKDELVETLPKILAFGDMMVEEAQKTGAQQLIKNANECKNALEAAVKTLKDFIGQEGDNITGNGTITGMIEGAKTIQKAFNGEV